MFGFHRHTWDEKARTWIPPSQHNLKTGAIEGSGAIILHYEFLNRMLFGCTSIEMECVTCHDKKEVVLIGRHLVS